MVAHRTDAAEPLHDHRDFPQKPPADESLESAELDDMQARLVDVVVGVQMDGHLAMPLDASDGRDLDQSGFGHFDRS